MKANLMNLYAPQNWNRTCMRAITGSARPHGVSARSLGTRHRAQLGSPTERKTRYQSIARRRRNYVTLLRPRRRDTGAARTPAPDSLVLLLYTLTPVLLVRPPAARPLAAGT